MRQKRSFILQLFLCLTLLSVCLFSYLEKQHELTELRIQLPKLLKEVKGIQEENARLQHQIQEFENPEHLMQLVSDVQYSHLKYPLHKEVLVFQESPQLQWQWLSRESKENVHSKFRHTLAVGAK